MTHDHFVGAAYGVTVIAIAFLILSSWLAMRKSEALAEDLKKDR